MPGYGARYWAELTPAAKRRKYPSLRGAGQHTADVVVIGGGLTGAAAACVLARAGLDVILVEAGRIASGATAGSLGVIAPQPDTTFRDLEAAVGLRRARTAWKEARLAALEMVAALRKLRIRCSLGPAPFVTNARGPEIAALLRREQAARKAAGIDAPWWPPAAASAAAGMATASSGALRLREGALFDPFRAAAGLVRAAEAAGARVFENSPVRRTRFTRTSADVILADATIRTRGIFVATGHPGSLFSSLGRHVRTAEASIVVTEPLTPAMRRATGRREVVIAEAGESRAERWLRWLPDGRAMFGGLAAQPAPARLAERVLVQRTGELMYELSVRYPVISGLPARWSWATPVVSTPDGLPWVGTHRNYPFHFFAMAFGAHGDGFSWFAAKAALRHFKDESTAGDDIYGFGRL